MTSLLQSIHFECAVCKAPVGRVRCWVNHDTQRHFFAFFCHGEIERVELSQADLESSTRIGIGRCFEGEALRAERKKLMTTESEKEARLRQEERQRQARMLKGIAPRTRTLFTVPNFEPSATALDLEVEEPVAVTDKPNAVLVTASGEHKPVHVVSRSQDVHELLGCDVFGIVKLKDGMMLVDDNGLIEGKPLNAWASEKYGFHCPGHSIVGDVLWFTHEAFLRFDQGFAE